jgi:DNA-binding NarL/FixJ family response regulator
MFSRVTTVTVPVAVVDPLPMYRQGVVACLSAAGHTVETPSDVLDWVRRHDRSMVLLTLESERSWDTLKQLRESSAVNLVVALLEENSHVLGAAAVRAGARSVLWRAVTAETLRRTVEATIDGQAVLPAAVPAMLAAGSAAGGGTGWSPEPEQVSWLRQLAAGTTVAHLADQVGYSERAMFRLLRALYDQMGVSSRTEAIIRAHELGWLTDSSSGVGPEESSGP